jgi:DNA-binding response OmpR family regulator
MHPKKILIVDDSELTLMFHKTVLDSDKYELILARSGKEALEKTRSQKPDLIVLDLLLPDMTGLDVCKELRSKRETKKVPIVMVTVQGKPDQERQAYENGCTDYITKPYKPSELVERINFHLLNAKSKSKSKSIDH